MIKATLTLTGLVLEIAALALFISAIALIALGLPSIWLA
jgi:hypothetical protein